MKIEFLKQNKLRLVLSDEDLTEYKIQPEELRGNAHLAAEIFYKMIKKVEDRTGLTLAGEKLMIEAYPSREEGFEVIITKLEGMSQVPSAAKKHKNVRIKAKQAVSMLFSFDSFNDVCAACKNAKDFLEGESSLYKYSDKYFLYTIGVLKNKDSLFSSYSEFGKAIYRLSSLGEICEYGTLLIKENAAEDLINNF